MDSALDSDKGSSSDLGGRGRFFRICRLLLDGAAELLRQQFDKIIPPYDLSSILQKEEENLRKLRTSVLTTDMLEILYPAPNTFGESADFDISLLMVLFRNLCELKAPPSSNNWRTMPSDNDKSVEADILRLKIYRNTIVAHAKVCDIADDEFEQVSKHIIAIFERLGGAEWKEKAENMAKEAGLSFGDFDNIEMIGQGTFAKVFKATHKLDRRTYAIKQSHVSVEQERIQKQFEKEVAIISHLESKNVVRYYSSFLDNNNCCCIMMEYCIKDLGKCFQCKSDMKNLIKPNFMKIFSHLIFGLRYIHSEGIIHRDLKPSNVFLSSLDSKCQAKIGDFGLACFEEQSVKSYFGSARYKAPEQSTRKYSNKVDMYSAGVILFELSKLEWENPNDNTNSWGEVLKSLRVNTRKVLEEFEPFHPKFVRILVGSLLEDSPDARPTAEEVSQELCKSLQVSDDKRDEDGHVIRRAKSLPNIYMEFQHREEPGKPRLPTGIEIPCNENTIVNSDVPPDAELEGDKDLEQKENKSERRKRLQTAPTQETEEKKEKAKKKFKNLGLLRDSFPEATEAECKAVLNISKGNLREAMKLMKIRKLAAQGLDVSIDECRQALKSCRWEFKAAIQHLICKEYPCLNKEDIEKLLIDCNWDVPSAMQKLRVHFYFEDCKRLGISDVDANEKLRCAGGNVDDAERLLKIQKVAQVTEKPEDYCEETLRHCLWKVERAIFYITSDSI